MTQRAQQRTREIAGLDGLAAQLLARPESVIALSTHYSVIEKLLGVHAKNCEVFVVELSGSGWKVLETRALSVEATI